MENQANELPTAATAAAAPDAMAGMPAFHDLSQHRQLDVASLRKLAAHPEAAKRIIAAQEKIFAHLDRMAEILAADLSQYQNKSAMPTGEMSMAQLSLISRKGQYDGKSRKDVAKDLLVASIVNYGNLDWEPTDPSTGWTPEMNPSTLLSLILLGPIEEPAAPSVPALGAGGQ